MYGTDITGSLNVCNQLLNEFPEMQTEFSRINVKRLCGFAGVGLNIQTREKPVRNLDDLNGLKLSISGTSYEIFSELGVEEIVVYQGQEYTSVAKREVDGTEGYIEFLSSFPDAEAVHYTTYLNLPFPAHDFYGMNLDCWNSLPHDLQKVFEDCGRWFHKEMTKAEIEITKKALTNAKAKGHKFIKFSRKDQDKFYSLIEKSASRKIAGLESLGLPGKKIFQRTRTLIKEYERNKNNG